MKKLFLALLLIPSLAFAQDIQLARLSPAIVGGGVPEAAPAFSWEIAEDFSASNGTNVTIAAGCVHDWTERVGDWTIASENLVDPGTTYNYISCDTTLDSSVRQYGKMLVGHSSQYWGLGFYFRGNTSGTGNSIRFSAADDEIKWQLISGWASGGDVDSDTWSVTYTGGWIGFEVSGSGAGTEVQYWYWADDPGDWDASHTNWGAPLGTLAGTSNNTGTTVGIRGNATASEYVSSFYAGSDDE